MTKKVKDEVAELKRVLNCVAFVHQKMITTNFYPEEFNVVTDSIKWLHGFAKELDDKIMEISPEDKKRVEVTKAQESKNLEKLEQINEQINEVTDGK